MAQRLRMAPDTAQKAYEDEIKHDKGITLRAQRGGTVILCLGWGKEGHWEMIRCGLLPGILAASYLTEP